jgi:hypothetical protein
MHHAPTCFSGSFTRETRGQNCATQSACCRQLDNKLQWNLNIFRLTGVEERAGMIMNIGRTATQPNDRQKNICREATFRFAHTLGVATLLLTNEVAWSPFNHAPLPALVHRYSFNETNGTVASDSIGGPVSVAPNIVGANYQLTIFPTNWTLFLRLER